MDMPTNASVRVPRKEMTKVHLANILNGSTTTCHMATFFLKPMH
jgi:hypothetical protein